MRGLARTPRPLFTTASSDQFLDPPGRSCSTRTASPMRAHESHWCARLQPSRRLEWPRVQTAEFRRADLGHIAWSCAFLVVRLAMLQGCRYSSPVPPSPAARLPAKARWWGLLVLGRTTPTIYLGLSYFDLQSRLVLATRSGDIAVRQQLPERQSQNDQLQAAFRISARRG